MDVQMKNSMKTKYYIMFDGKVDKEIIDAVLQSCDYKDEQVYQSLIEMAGDALDMRPPPPPVNSMTGSSSSELDARSSYYQSFNRGNNDFRIHHETIETDCLRTPAVSSFSPTIDKSADVLRDLTHQSFEREVLTKKELANSSSGFYIQEQGGDRDTDMVFALGNKCYQVPSVPSKFSTQKPSIDMSTLPPLPEPKDDYLDTHLPLHQQLQHKDTIPSSFGISEPSVLQQPSIYGNHYSSLSSYGQYETLLSPSRDVKSKTTTPVLATPTQDDKAILYQDQTMHWLVLMRGLPGSGKSTKAKQLSGGKGLILSTDNYFIDDQGRYKFNPSSLPEAHDWNQKKAKDAMVANISPIFIDNTNTEAWNMKPYVETALRYQYLVAIVEPDTEWAWNPSVLARRNQHGVRADAIQRMKDKYDRNVTVKQLTSSIKPQRPLSNSSSNTTTTTQDVHATALEEQRDKQQKQQQQQQQRLLTPHFVAENLQQHSPLRHSFPHDTTNVAIDNSSSDYVTMDQIRNRPTHPRHNLADLYFQDIQMSRYGDRRFHDTLLLAETGNPTHASADRHYGTLPSNIRNSQSYANRNPFDNLHQQKPSSPLSSPFKVEPSYVKKEPFQHIKEEYGNRTLTSTKQERGSSSVQPVDYRQLNEMLKQSKVDSNPASPLSLVHDTEYLMQGATSAHGLLNTVDNPEEFPLVKNSSGTTLTAKQLKIRENLHRDFSHVDKEALDQLLESCSYNYEAASNFVRCSVPVPTTKNKQKDNEKQTTTTTPRRRTQSESKDNKSTTTTPNNVNSTKKSNGKQKAATSSSEDYEHVIDQKYMAAASSSSTTTSSGPVPSLSDDLFSEPPKVSRTAINDDIGTASGYQHSPVSSSARTSSGKIDNIVKTYKSVKSKLDVIEINDSGAVPSCSSYTNEFNAFMEYNLEFLYECFPNYPKKYCQKWLKLYSGDLVKTCDYLSRRSQADDLPPEVINVDSDDDFEMVDISSDDDEDENDDQPSYSHVGDVDVAAATTTETKNTVSTPPPSSTVGALFLGDEVQSSETVTMAIDKSLGIELKKRFGGNNDFSDDELDNEDLVFTLDKDIANLLYKAWNSSIKERKRKHDYLDEDERIARELQDQEDKEVSSVREGQADKTDGRSKKKKAKETKMNIAYTRDELTQLQTQSVSPWSIWNKSSNENEVTSVEDCSGKKLTKKQVDARRILYSWFPGVNEDSLDQILEASSYNVDAASKLVTQSTGAEKNTDEVGDSGGWKLVTSPPRKKHNDSNTPGGLTSSTVEGPVIAGFQALSEDNQSYTDLRAEAQIHANLRTEYFRKAAEAFSSKNGQLAQYYADKARDHTDQMQDAHFRAAEMTLLRRNKAYLNEQKIIDLHGLHAEEAVRALKNFLDNAVNIGHKEVEIITGRGNHSKHGISTVRNAILNHLIQKQYKYQLRNNGGSVKIRL